MDKYTKQAFDKAFDNNYWLHKNQDTVDSLLFILERLSAAGVYITCVYSIRRRGKWVNKKYVGFDSFILRVKSSKKQNYHLTAKDFIDRLDNAFTDDEIYKIKISKHQIIVEILALGK